MSATPNLRPRAVREAPVAPASPAAPDGSGDQALDPALALVLARVQLRARRRVEWLRHLWRDDEALATTSAVSHAEVDVALDDRDNPDAESAWYLHLAGSVEAETLDAIEAALAADASSRLGRLCRVFAMGAVERDLLQACVAALLDPALLRIFAYLQDHAGRAHVTDSLVARLFGHGRAILVDAESPLVRWLMIESSVPAPGEPRVHALDPFVRDWLLGSDAPDPDLAAIVRTCSPRPPLADWPVDELVASLQGWLAGSEPTSVRVRVSGAPGSGRRTFAATVAARLGLPLIALDVGAVREADWPRLYVKGQRQAFLHGAALALIGEAPLPEAGFEAIAHFPLHFLIGEGARSPRWNPAGVDHAVELPALSIDARRSLWETYVPWAAAWPEAERETLVTQHRSSPGDLARLGLRGPSEPEEAAMLLRESARDSLGDLAQRLDCPFTRDDLVVTSPLERTLDELLFEARDRAAFWEGAEARRLFPQGRGLIALFCGPPGTGKTMSAQVIAAALRMDLFRIDLAAVVSKWVGESSRNLDRLLSRAARLDVVLLFDEADALFGRRTEIKDANDRFANTDTGYLLQAIESYRGIAILATNRKGDIDPAFVRRLRYVVDYPMPDESERRRIWRRLVAELGGPDRATQLRPDLDRIASAVEMTGAQIKFSVLNAVFAARRDARPIEAGDLLRGLERELAKEGRSLGDRMRERLGSHAV